MENGSPHTQGEQGAGRRLSASAGQMPILLLLIAVLAVSVIGLATAAIASGSTAQLPPMLLPGDASVSSGGAASPDSNRWILGARPGAKAERIATRHGADPVSRSAGIYAIARAGANGLAESLRQAGILVFAEPNVSTAEAGYPIDLTTGSQWWLNRIVNTIETTPPPVTPNSPRLGLIEESLNPDHPDLLEANIKGAKSIGPAEDDHGTSIAAIAGSPVEGSQGGDDKNIVGVWPGMNMTLFPSGDKCLSATKAVLKAAKSGVPVINMSYGFAGDACFSHYVATETAVRSGVLPVAAAGNTFGPGGNVPSRPATDPHVISVSSVDAADAVAPLATRNNQVDITAPGEGILAPIVQLLGGGGSDPIVDFDWGLISGTSYSAPMVSAAATWLVQARPELDDRQIARVLTGSATDLGDPGRDPSYGEGLLNIDSALARPVPPDDPGEPNDDITWVNGSLLKNSSGFLWKPGKVKRKSIIATLSLQKDAADVYRVRLPRKSRVLITAAQFQGDVKLRVFRPKAKTITKGKGQIIVRSDQVRPKTEGVRVKNTKRRTQLVYVAITPSPRQAGEYMRYKLEVKGR